ncbi:uncharacterized protein LOC105925180 isoform X3 [Fundulus heteroclitus]|uniref:uncharacterized protein LOC105925180 isoform X2 n=1 Tax=Fundulus heteroclitus TaxID=8078 RepID=UPI00165C5220|nr:uncharacterized protein LOC105925180 isoform X2 [Fundulus heteroclitus]XP_035993813.1 uncharacterized protein LOC105925180 isoform X3 [Fundulus heteroclitus]
MACRQTKGSAILAYLGLLVFVTSPCRCAKLTRLKALDESRESPVHTKSRPDRGPLHNGRLLIMQNSLKDAKLNGTNATEPVYDVEADYQADMGWQTKQLTGKTDWQKKAMESLLKMESKVECMQDSMKLLVHDAASTPASLIFVDRGNLSPLSLTKLPSSCGYTIRSTQKDLVLMAPYNGCFIVFQENYYVLPLLWWGLPVKMTCPLMEHVSQNPPMVTCHAEGMIVKTEWTTSASKIKVNVNGNWESLLTAAQRCVFGIVEHPEGVVISVHYAPCLVKKDGMYTLELAADAETKVSCPPLSAAPHKLTESQVKGSGQESDIPGKWENHFPTPYPSLTFPPAQTASQVPASSQTPKVPSKPNLGSKPKLFPYFSGFPDAYLQSPDISPTKPPQTPTSAFPFYPHPLYPQFLHPVMPEMMQPEIKSPFYELDDNQMPNKFRLPLYQKPEPPSSYPEAQEDKFNIFHDTKVLSQLANSYLYLERLSEKPGQSHPIMSEKGQTAHMPFRLICTRQMAASKPSGLSQSSWYDMFKGEVHQLFALVCTQVELTLKPGDVLQPPYPETPKGQVHGPFYLLCALQTPKLRHSKTSQGYVYHSFYVLCIQHKQSSKPAEVAWAQESPKGHLYQAFYPFLFSKKSIGDTEPLQSVTQPQVYPHLVPFYHQPKPTQKPAVTQPPPQATPQPQVYPQFPFYPHPSFPTQKPAVTLPLQQATPQPQVYPQFHFYPQQKPTQKPATHPLQETPQPQVYPQFFPFYSQQKPAQKPALTQPPQATPQLQVYPQFPFYPHPSFPTQKPAVTRPLQQATPQPQVYPKFNFYPHPKPTQKPATHPPQETPQPQVYPQFFPFYSQQKPGQNPAVTQPPPPQATPQPQVYPKFNFYPHPKPTQKPATHPPQETPQPQVYPQFFPFYSQQKPGQNPAVTQPPPPPQATPQPQVYPQFNFYPHPKPTQKPAVTQPPQQATPQPQVYPHLFPFYPQQKTTQMPATHPPQTPQPQVYPRLFNFYSQQKPNQKPAVTLPPQKETPQPQVDPQLLPFYSQQKQTQRPITRKPQPATQQAQVYPPFFYFYTQPTVVKLTVTQSPQPATSQSKVYMHFSDFNPKVKPASNPVPVTLPQQLQLSKGQAFQPFYNYYLQTQPKTTSSPTAEPQTLQPKDPMGQERQQMCFYSQLLPENRLANIPTKTAEGHVYGPCQQSKQPDVEMSETVSMGNHQYSQPAIASSPQGQIKYPFNSFHYSQHPQSAYLSSTSMQQPRSVANEQKMNSFTSTHAHPVYCPQYCPSGLSNCCLEIAFHQHLHISAPGDIKAEPQFYTNFSLLPYSDFSQGLETAEISQKLSAVLQAVRSGAATKFSPRAPQSPYGNKYFFNPPDGILSSRRSSRSMTANQKPVYPHFGNKSLNPLWDHVAQNVELQGLEQGKSESPNDSSKPWASDNEQGTSVVHYEPFNVRFSDPSIHSRPSFMSHLSQHGLHIAEQPNKPALERHSTHHDFKRAIDRSFSTFYMPGDSSVSNNTVSLNGSKEQPSKTGPKNPSKLQKAQNLHSGGFVLLQHGPPGREPSRFSDSQMSFDELSHGANSKTLKLLRQHADPQTLESMLEEKEKRLEEVSTYPPGDTNLQRNGYTSGSFIPKSDDSKPASVLPKQSFSAEQLRPEILKSFESLWKSQTPSDFKQFLANVPVKTEELHVGSTNQENGQASSDGHGFKREMSFLQ